MSNGMLSEPTTEMKIETESSSIPAGDEMMVDKDDNQFTSQLPEMIRENKSLAKFKSVEDLATSYLELENAFGSRVKLPGKDSTPEDRAAFLEKIADIPDVVVKPDPTNENAKDLFYKSLGVPENPRDYVLPEDMELDQKTFDELTRFAHNAKMSNEQLVVMAEARREELTEAANKAAELREKSETILKDKWGEEQYDSRMQGARRALNLYREEYGDMVDSLLEGGAENNAAFIAMLSELGHRTGETKDVKQEAASYGITAQEAEQKLAEIRSHEGYTNSAHPQHKILHQQAYKLLRIITGES